MGREGRVEGYAVCRCQGIRRFPSNLLAGDPHAGPQHQSPGPRGHLFPGRVGRCYERGQNDGLQLGEARRFLS